MGSTSTPVRSSQQHGPMRLCAPAPRFSIVVPAFNEQATLGRTLAALRAQVAAREPGEAPVEVIVVDNGSTDATPEIARAYGAAVVTEPARGVVHARETGFRAARGDIVVTTDADTVTPPGWLAAIDAAWAAHPEAALVAGPCRYTLDSPRWGRLIDLLIFGLVGAIHRHTGWVGYVSATNLSFRREAFPGYDLTLTQGGDEWGVLAALRPAGKMVWLADNPTHTSGRRLRRGPVRTLFVSGGWDYFVTYAVNRLAGRPVLGNAPAVRDPATRAVGATRGA